MNENKQLAAEAPKGKSPRIFWDEEEQRKMGRRLVELYQADRRRSAASLMEQAQTETLPPERHRRSSSVTLERLPSIVRDMLAAADKTAPSGEFDRLVAAVVKVRLTDPLQHLVLIYNELVKEGKFGAGFKPVVHESLLPAKLVDNVKLRLARLASPPPPVASTPYPSTASAPSTPPGMPPAGQLLQALQNLVSLLVETQFTKGTEGPAARVETAQKEAVAEALKMVESKLPELVNHYLEERLLHQRSELESLMMELLEIHEAAAHHLGNLPAVTPEAPETTVPASTEEVLGTALETETQPRFKVSLVDGLLNKYAKRLRHEVPDNIKLIEEPVDQNPPNTVGRRHYVILTNRTPSQWRQAYERTLPPNQIIKLERPGLERIKKELEKISEQPYFTP